MHKKHETLIHKVLHIIERIIAFITLAVMLFMLGLEIYKMFTTAEYFATMDRFLQNILPIVVGLEFVRMLIDLTPANTIEVLIVAIARQVILTHNNPWANLASVLCIAGLFAIRKFLLSENDVKKELKEHEDDF